MSIRQQGKQRLDLRPTIQVTIGTSILLRRQGRIGRILLLQLQSREHILDQTTLIRESIFLRATITRTTTGTTTIILRQHQDRQIGRILHQITIRIEVMFLVIVARVDRILQILVLLVGIILLQVAVQAGVIRLQILEHPINQAVDLHQAAAVVRGVIQALEDNF